LLLKTSQLGTVYQISAPIGVLRLLIRKQKKKKKTKKKEKNNNQALTASPKTDCGFSLDFDEKITKKFRFHFRDDEKKKSSSKGAVVKACPIRPVRPKRKRISLRQKVCLFCSSCFACSLTCLFSS
jgi:ferredoxin-like protein FixX